MGMNAWANESQPRPGQRWTRLFLGLILPVVLATIIFIADYLEGPQTAFVGIVTSLPLMSAIFSRPLTTSLVSLYVLIGAIVHGFTTSDSFNSTQWVRITFITLSGALAIIYSAVREKQEAERRELRSTNVELEATSELALFDSLTGLLNRRGVYDHLAAESTWPRTVALFDVDKLKEINDTYGHPVGDAFIRTVGERLRSSLASSDIVSRWGGDEFLVILPLPASQTQAVIERVLAAVCENPMSLDSHVVIPSMSAGLCPWRAEETLDETITQADEALYRAKVQGGNTIVWATAHHL